MYRREYFEYKINIKGDGYINNYIGNISTMYRREYFEYKVNIKGDGYINNQISLSQLLSRENFITPPF